jgi:hypothetical protein
MSISTGGDKEPVKSLSFYDSQNTLETETLGKKLGMDTKSFEFEVFSDESNSKPETQNSKLINDEVDYAIAYGAALTHLEKGRPVNFRDDFSPFQGKKKKLHKSIKFASASVTILLAAIGLFLHTQLFIKGRDINSLRDKFSREYTSVYRAKLSDNTSIKQAADNLTRLLRGIQAEKSGLVTDDQSISAKLTLVLTAINKCAAKTDLKIKKIDITVSSITIAGDTDTLAHTQDVFAEIRKSGMEIPEPNFQPQGSRTSFNISIQVPKAAKETL